MTVVEKMKKYFEDKGLTKDIKIFFEEQAVAPIAVAPIAAPVAVAAPVVALAKMAMKLKDGSELSHDGEVLAVGANVFVTDAEGVESAALDNNYELEDGTIVTVVSGVVTEIKPVEAAPIEEPTSNVMEQLAEVKTTLSLQAAKIKDLETKLEVANKNTMTAFTALKAITEMEVTDSVTAPTKAYKDMNNAEKIKFNRS